ncbi:chromatin remodelling complex Rsc7/Swp82 subunit-domain-containing protein [Cristinia sonorae]|uniref:Chromatin remodelling complex Rsc7/Swp82 subunit-domain-containing protein n=1 Tax=Cristinia sonorae TaxID=1940300 RepID=A0A8K0XRB1_9AGAR|nr:chromatin remodelling complex Rsc7/Swp82 subunit-domain-containing protein [Cristinia sonorae]
MARDAEGSGAEGEDGTGPLAGGKPFRIINGIAYVIDGDEYVTEDDPKGDTKIDKDGVLLGGRRFKAPTFTLPSRHPTRQYMLAIDAARTSGFRDSLYYFRRNPLALKLNAEPWETEHLVDVGKLGSHLRTRTVTLITARSAFKFHGAKMIVDGRWITDDYYEDKVLPTLAEKGAKPGDLVGELPDPSTGVASSTNLNNLNSALLNAGSDPKSSGPSLGMYRAGGPTTIFGGSGFGPYSDGPLNAVRKSYLNREGLNEENWMWVAAKRTVEMGEEWSRLRRENLKVLGGIYGDDVSKLGGAVAVPEKRDLDGNMDVDAERQPDATVDMRKKKKRKASKPTCDDGPYPLGVYEPQTGIVLYRLDTQPKHSRWEPVPDSERKQNVLGGTKVGNGAWGLAWVDTVVEYSPHLPQPQMPEDVSIG